MVCCNGIAPWNSALYVFDYDDLTQTLTSVDVLPLGASNTNESHGNYAIDKNPVTGEVFILHSDETQSSVRLMYQVDLSNGSLTLVSPSLGNVSDFTFALDGTCYAYKGNKIYTVDLTSGVLEEYVNLSSTGISGGAKGLTYDYDSNRLLVANGDNLDVIVGEVNLNTGVAQILFTTTELGYFDSTLQGLEYIGNGQCLLAGTYGHGGFGYLDLSTGTRTYTTDYDDTFGIEDIKDLLMPFSTGDSADDDNTARNTYKNAYLDSDRPIVTTTVSSVQTITVTDNTAPVGSVVAASVACAVYDADTAYGSHSEADNCDTDVAVSWVNGAATNVTGAGCYTVPRTYTFTDDCGNSSTQVQTITVFDNVAPALSIPANYAVNADATDCSADITPSAAGQATATDNCDSDVTITHSDSQWSYSCTGDDNDTEGTRTLTRTWTATDDCGLWTSLGQTITVTDVTAPVLTIPADYGVNADATDCSADITPSAAGQAAATDNCDSDVAISYSDSEWTYTCAGNPEGTRTLTRTWTATDDCGNATSATQTITIVDTTAPVLSVPADYSSECDVDLVLDDATATDNCSGATITYSEETTAATAIRNTLWFAHGPRLMVVATLLQRLRQFQLLIRLLLRSQMHVVLTMEKLLRYAVRIYLVR